MILTSETNTSTTTNFKDNTVLPELPVFKEMTEEEQKKGTKKLDEFASTIMGQVNDAMSPNKEDDK